MKAGGKAAKGGGAARKQEERLWEKERLRKQEERLTLSQNHKLDKQLAEPQCGFEDLVGCPTWGACPHPCPSRPLFPHL